MSSEVVAREQSLPLLQYGGVRHSLIMKQREEHREAALKLASWMMEHGADVNAANSDKKSPLQCALANRVDNEALILLLRRRGAASLILASLNAHERRVLNEVVQRGSHGDLEPWDMMKGSPRAPLTFVAIAPARLAGYSYLSIHLEAHCHGGDIS